MSTPLKCGPRKIPVKDTNHTQDNFTNNTSGNPPTLPRCAKTHLSCLMQNGISMVCDSTSSYYIFNKKEGRRLLVLTRKQNESIVIDDSIDIEVLEINGNQVKLGIICPDDMVVRCNDTCKDSKNNGTVL
jgi:carbon storage regulator CsrA